MMNGAAAAEQEVQGDEMMDFDDGDRENYYESMM